MAIKASSNPSFNNASLPNEWQWREDCQTERHALTKDYIALAKTMAEPTIHWFLDVLTEAGFVHENQHQAIFEKIIKLKPSAYLHLPNISFAFRIKTEKSCKEKIDIDSITNKAKLPRDIGDYVGIEAVGHSKEDVGKLIDAMIRSGNMSSRKNQFAEESEEGHMSHKSHHTMEHDGRRMSIEAKISDINFVRVDPITHRLLQAQRSLRGFQSDVGKVFGCTPGTNARFAAFGEFLQSLRIAINKHAQIAGGYCSSSGDDTFEISHLSRKSQKRMIAMLGIDTVSQIKALFPSNDDILPKHHAKKLG